MRLELTPVQARVLQQALAFAATYEWDQEDEWFRTVEELERLVDGLSLMFHQCW